MGCKGVTKMGLFGDIFEDDDFEISSEEEEIELEFEVVDKDDEWFDGKKQKGATWDTGRKPDIWNADEPWTCDDDCDPKSDCGGCSSDSSKKNFDMDDFFS